MAHIDVRHQPVLALLGSALSGVAGLFGDDRCLLCHESEGIARNRARHSLSLSPPLPRKCSAPAMSLHHAPCTSAADIPIPHLSTTRHALTLDNIVHSFFTWRADMLASLGAKGLLEAIGQQGSPAKPLHRTSPSSGSKRPWLLISRRAMRQREQVMQAQMAAKLAAQLAREAAVAKVVQEILLTIGWDLRQKYASYFSLPSHNKAERLWDLIHGIWLHEWATCCSSLLQVPS